MKLDFSIFTKIPLHKIRPETHNDSAEGYSDIKSNSTTKPSPSPSSNKAKNKLSFLRLLLLFILCVTGLSTGSVLSYVIRTSRLRTYKDDFLVMVDGNYRALTHALVTNKQLSSQVALNRGLACPYAEDWPNCHFSSTAFEKQVRSLHNVAALNFFAVTPIVTPSNRQSFEEFVQRVIALNESQPGMKILESYALSEKKTSFNHSKMTYDLALPITEISNLTLLENLFLRDYYSDPQVRPTIDAVLECELKYLSNTTDELIQQDCRRWNSFISLPRQSPIGFVAVPITPANSPQEQVLM